MPQRIEVPGMGVVEFPDGMSDEQIAGAIKQNMQGQSQPPASPSLGPMDIFKEGGRIAATSLYEGATAIPRLLGTLSEPGEKLKRRFIPGYAEMADRAGAAGRCV